MQIGASTASCTARNIAFSSSGSSTSGIPALTSSMLAPALTCASASTVTVDRSPPRSSSANALRPVGLIRSPITQSGWSAPIVTLADRDRRTVSMCLSLLFGGDSEARTQFGDPRVLPKRDEVQPRDSGLAHRVVGQLVGDLEALGLGIDRRLDSADQLRRHVDPGDAGGDE